MRGRDANVRSALAALIEADSLAITEPVMMELLAGAEDTDELCRLRRLTETYPILSVSGVDDWELAAAVYRKCRRAGVTPRSQIDCLIAAVAIREDVEILHSERDFDAIAKHTPLRVASV